ncbi:hypothetical protein EOE67_15280 [Rheinheimera riviphila]|uniref:Uncharacterized protein n=1 Tax=Rheinheimera riviphila TaxID=1834037 RepID=A0A437QJ39_9GAMM|nr:hypothetical protein [Rheinheimera riviphila]RVU34410.1 hypothetical protein EOE67_15280 [Rheinheimera riviphila]
MLLLTCCFTAWDVIKLKQLLPEYKVFFGTKQNDVDRLSDGTLRVYPTLFELGFTWDRRALLAASAAVRRMVICQGLA